MEELAMKPFAAVKLNYNIDPSLQRYSQYECKIQLSSDFENLNIFNLKPKDTPIFSVKNMGKKSPNSMDDGLPADFTKLMAPEPLARPNSISGFNLEESSKNLKRAVANEHFNQMVYCKSRKSCSIDSIDKFIYGPVTSRFWIMRKHICMSTIRELTN